MKPQITKKALLDFCSKKPEDEKYLYVDPYNCAVAQFLKSIGVENYILTADEIPNVFYKEVVAEPWTFGALTKRLSR